MPRGVWLRDFFISSSPSRREKESDARECGMRKETSRSDQTVGLVAPKVSMSGEAVDPHPALNVDETDGGKRIVH